MIHVTIRDDDSGRTMAETTLDRGQVDRLVQASGLTLEEVLSDLVGRSLAEAHRRHMEAERRRLIRGEGSGETPRGLLGGSHG